MWTKAFEITQFEQTFYIITKSNSTVTDLAFDLDLKTIEFEVTGTPFTKGVCNVTIPKALLDADPGEWTVLVAGSPVTSVVTENATHSFIYFSYGHSAHTVTITGTQVIQPTPPPPVGGKTTPLPHVGDLATSPDFLLALFIILAIAFISGMVIGIGRTGAFAKCGKEKR